MGWGTQPELSSSSPHEGDGAGCMAELSSSLPHEGDGAGQGAQLSCHRHRHTKETGQGVTHRLLVRFCLLCGDWTAYCTDMGSCECGLPFLEPFEFLLVSMRTP